MSLFGIRQPAVSCSFFSFRSALASANLALLLVISPGNPGQKRHRELVPSATIQGGTCCRQVKPFVRLFAVIDPSPDMGESVVHSTPRAARRAAPYCDGR